MTGQHPSIRKWSGQTMWPGTRTPRQWDWDEFPFNRVIYKWSDWCYELSWSFGTLERFNIKKNRWLDRVLGKGYWEVPIQI